MQTHPRWLAFHPPDGSVGLEPVGGASMSGPGSKRQVVAWALYDWGNSAFATAVVAGFFPIMFKEYWSAGVEVTASTFRLGMANSISSLVLVLAAPFLGAIADQGGYKKRLLVSFAFIGCMVTISLAFTAAGHWSLAVVLFLIANLGFAGANIFYDALILDVSDRRSLDRVSGLGFALGYLGGGVFFGFCVAMTSLGPNYGVARQTVVLASFVLTGIWWLAFTVPLAVTVKEQRYGHATDFAESIRSAVVQLRVTVGKIGQHRNIVLFLLAYWLYIDGVDTIIRMAVDYGMSLGMDSQSLIKALLLTQFIGFPSALAFGWLGSRIGPKKGILIGLSVYIIIIAWSYRLESEHEFFAIATLIGLVQGGVQSLSRSLYARLIPRHEAGEFFGFYNLLGKFAAVIGPALMGWVGVVSGSPRLSVAVIAVLFIAGASLLIFVETPARREGHF